MIRRTIRTVFFVLLLAINGYMLLQIQQLRGDVAKLEAAKTAIARSASVGDSKARALDLVSAHLSRADGDLKHHRQAAALAELQAAGAAIQGAQQSEWRSAQGTGRDGLLMLQHVRAQADEMWRRMQRLEKGAVR